MINFTLISPQPVGKSLRNFILTIIGDGGKAALGFEIASELLCPWQRIAPIGYNGGNAVNTLAPLLLIGSSSFLQVRRTTIKSWTSSKFDQIGLWTAELAALERLEKSP